MNTGQKWNENIEAMINATGIAMNALNRSQMNNGSSTVESRTNTMIAMMDVNMIYSP